MDVDIANAIDDCESPIEQLFAVALSQIPSVKSAAVLVEPQYTIKMYGHKYRVDFLLTMNDLVTIDDGNIEILVDEVVTEMVIECDGFEYHSEKDQIIADNKRTLEIVGPDRYLIRFLGSEINEDATGCAIRAINKLNYIHRMRCHQIEKVARDLSQTYQSRIRTIRSDFSKRLAEARNAK